MVNDRRPLKFQKYFFKSDCKDLKIENIEIFNILKLKIKKNFLWKDCLNILGLLLNKFLDLNFESNYFFGLNF